MSEDRPDRDAALAAWLDSGADDLAEGVTAAEQGVDVDSLRQWLDVVEESVKPL